MGASSAAALFESRHKGGTGLTGYEDLVPTLVDIGGPTGGNDPNGRNYSVTGAPNTRNGAVTALSDNSDSTAVYNFGSETGSLFDFDLDIDMSNPSQAAGRSVASFVFIVRMAIAVGGGQSSDCHIGVFFGPRTGSFNAFPAQAGGYVNAGAGMSPTDVVLGPFSKSGGGVWAPGALDAMRLTLWTADGNAYSGGDANAWVSVYKVTARISYAT